MADGAFQLDAFQNDAFQIVIMAVWPDPAVVLLGVVYGPNGNDYVGTYVCPTVSSRPIFIFDD